MVSVIRIKKDEDQISFDVSFKDNEVGEHDVLS